MWSGSLKHANLYLGQRVALLQIGKAPHIVLRHPPGTLLSAVLSEVSAQADDALRGGRVKVTLSALHAPPISYRVPAEVKRRDERLAIARAAAAETMSVDVDQLECQLPFGRDGIAVAVQSDLIQSLQGWIKTHGGRIVSLRPLWSVATESRPAAKLEVRGIVLHEPEATTVLVPGEIKAHPLTARVFAGGSTASVIGATEVLLRGAGEPAVARLRFSVDAVPTSAPISKDWPQHWELL